MLTEILFALSVIALAYTYAGYPVLLSLVAGFWSRPVRRSDVLPTVSLIIAAHNEERDIERKIQNSLQLDYPKEKLQVIVASDCSSDRTDEIARRYSDRNVLLYRVDERLGKSVAQNRAVKASTGEILLFSDATTLYQPDAARKIVQSFADPEVGCVAGQLIYADSFATDTSRGCKSYWSYEKFLRHLESQMGSLIGVSGCLYAVRRSSYSRIAMDMSSDFAIALEVHQSGLRTVYEPEAIAVEPTNKRGTDELQMRVRVIEQTLSALSIYRELLNPMTHGLFALQLISHKLLRYATPLFLLIAFVSNALLVGTSALYSAFFAAQVMFYLIAGAGKFCEPSGIRLGVAGFPYYFLLTSVASIGGFLKFVRGEAHTIWEPLRETAE